MYKQKGNLTLTSGSTKDIKSPLARSKASADVTTTIRTNPSLKVLYTHAACSPSIPYNGTSNSKCDKKVDTARISKKSQIKCAKLWKIFENRNLNNHQKHLVRRCLNLPRTFSASTLETMTVEPTSFAKTLNESFCDTCTQGTTGTVESYRRNPGLNSLLLRSNTVRRTLQILLRTVYEEGLVTAEEKLSKTPSLYKTTLCFKNPRNKSWTGRERKKNSNMNFEEKYREKIAADAFNKKIQSFEPPRQYKDLNTGVMVLLPEYFKTTPTCNLLEEGNKVFQIRKAKHVQGETVENMLSTRPRKDKVDTYHFTTKADELVLGSPLPSRIFNSSATDIRVYGNGYDFGLTKGMSVWLDISPPVHIDELVFNNNKEIEENRPHLSHRLTRKRSKTRMY